MMNENEQHSATPHAVAFLICVMALAWYAWFLTPGPGPDINGHVGLASSVVLDHHVDLHRYYRNTGQHACIGDNYYSSKAPGTAWLALPALTYWSFERVVEPGDPWQVWFMALFTTALPSALIAALLFLFVHTASGRDTGAALTAALGYAFATAAFPEATLFSAHQPVALMLLVLFFMGYGARGRATCSPATDAVFGFVLAMAAATEYASAAPGAGLAVYYLAARRGSVRMAAAAMLAGALLPLACWFAYNDVVFGHAIDFATRYPCPHQPQHDMPGLFQSLFIPGAGLIFTSPFLLLAVPGLWFMARKQQLRSEALVLGFAILAILACHVRGGARDLLPMLPLCAAAAGLFLPHLPRAWRAVVLGILAACAANMLLLAITLPRIQGGPHFLIAQSALPLLKRGLSRPTVLCGFTDNVFLQLAPPAIWTLAAGLLLFRSWRRDAAIKQKSNNP